MRLVALCLLLSLCGQIRGGLIDYTYTTYSNVLLPKIGETSWVQYDLEFSTNDLMFDLDPVNFPLHQDNVLTLCANWSSATTYNTASGFVSDSPIVFTTTTPQQLFSIKVTNPDTCGTVIVVVTPVNGSVNSVVLRDSQGNSLHTSTIGTTTYNGFSGNTEVGIAVDCCDRIRKFIGENDKNTTWDGYLQVEVNFYQIPGQYSIRTQSSPFNLSLSEFYPILPLRVSCNTTKTARSTYGCPPFNFPASASSLSSIGLLCSRLKPVTDPLSALIDGWRNSTQLAPTSQKISFGFIHEIPTQNYTFNSFLDSCVFSFPTLKDSAMVAPVTGYLPITQDLSCSCDYDNFAKAKEGFTYFLSSLNTQKQPSSCDDTYTPYDDSIYAIASIMTSTPFTSCLHLAKSMLNFSSNSKGLSDRTGVVGDKYNGYFLGIVEGSTKCPLKYGTIKSAFGNSSSDCSLVDIGADPCCNTSLAACCTPRCIAGPTIPNITSLNSHAKSVCEIFNSCPNRATGATSFNNVECYADSLAQLRSSLLPDIQTDFTDDPCEGNIRNLSLSTSIYPVFDQCIQTYFQVGCTSTSYRCQRTQELFKNQTSVCTTRGFCSIPCESDSDCLPFSPKGKFVGCITLPEDNVKTCDVPPLGVVDMDTLRSFSECFYSKLSPLEKGVLGDLCGYTSSENFTVFLDHFGEIFIGERCEGGRIDRTLDTALNIQIDYPGVYSQKNWNKTSCNSDGVCNWVFNSVGQNTNPYISKSDCEKNSGFFCGYCADTNNEFCSEVSLDSPVCVEAFVYRSAPSDCRDYGSVPPNTTLYTHPLYGSACLMPITDESQCLRNNQCLSLSILEDMTVCDNSYCVSTSASLNSNATLCNNVTGTMFSDPTNSSQPSVCWYPGLPRANCTSGKSWTESIRQWRFPQIYNQSLCEARGNCLVPPFLTSIDTSLLTDQSYCESEINCYAFNPFRYSYPDLQDVYVFGNVSDQPTCKTKGWCRGRNMFECLHPTATPTYDATSQTYLCPANFVPTYDLTRCNYNYKLIVSNLDARYSANYFANWKENNPGMEFLQLWTDREKSLYFSACPYNITWFYETFPTRESCENSTMACVKISVNGSVAVVGKNQAYCESCNQNTDVTGDVYVWKSPFTWMKATFDIGRWRPYAWVQRKFITSTYNWTSMINETKFNGILDRIKDKAYRFRHGAFLACRNYPRFEALSRLSCGCGGTKSCVDAIYGIGTKAIYHVQPICRNSPDVRLSEFGTIGVDNYNLDECASANIYKILYKQFLSWGDVSLQGLELVPALQKQRGNPLFIANSKGVIFARVAGNGWEFKLGAPVSVAITLNITLTYSEAIPADNYLSIITSDKSFNVDKSDATQYFQNMMLQNKLVRMKTSDLNSGSVTIGIVVPENSSGIVVFPVMVDPSKEDASYVDSFDASGKAVIFIGLIFYIILFGISCWQLVLHMQQSERGPFKSWSLPKLAVCCLTAVDLVKLIFYIFMPTGVYQTSPAFGTFIDQLSSLLFFNIATVVVLRWAEIHHFTMNQQQQQAGSVLKQLFPVAIGVTGFLYLFWIILLIAFFSVSKSSGTYNCLAGAPTPSPELRTIASVYRGVFAALCILLSFGFAFYSFQIFTLINESRAMAKNRAGSEDDSIAKTIRLMTVSIGSVISLLGQAIYLIVVISDPKASDFQPWRLGIFLILEMLPNLGFLNMFQASSVFTTRRSTLATAKSSNASAKSRGITSRETQN